MRYFPFVILIFFLFGCRSLAPNRMFLTPKDYAFAKDSTKVGESMLYQIQPFDRIQIRIFSNDGYKLVDITQSNSFTGNTGENLDYLVEDNGEVKVPLLGKIYVNGLTVKQAQALFEEKYSLYYHMPFILVKVTNRTVLVFQGETGQGEVVTLQNDNTTLFEALAMAGGITNYAKAYRIKIIRGDVHNPTIYLADVSTVEGLKNSELKIRSNDIIYVEAVPNYTDKILSKITPIIGIIGAVVLVLNLTK